jgi:hypothetical protein
MENELEESFDGLEGVVNDFDDWTFFESGV